MVTGSSLQSTGPGTTSYSQACQLTPVNITSTVKNLLVIEKTSVSKILKNTEEIISPVSENH
jgi:hypothetical protein